MWHSCIRLGCLCAVLQETSFQRLEKLSAGSRVGISSTLSVSGHCGLAQVDRQLRNYIGGNDEG